MPNRMPVQPANTLVTNPYGLLRHFPQLNLFVFLRRGEPFPDTDALHSTMALFAHALSSIPHADSAILVDLRNTPGRNDPAFETAMAYWRPRMFAGFPKIAILVKTVLGKLQVARHAQTDRLPFFVCYTLEEAASYVGVWLPENVLADTEERGLP